MGYEQMELPKSIAKSQPDQNGDRKLSTVLRQRKRRNASLVAHQASSCVSLRQDFKKSCTVLSNALAALQGRLAHPPGCL